MRISPSTETPGSSSKLESECRFFAPLVHSFHHEFLIRSLEEIHRFAKELFVETTKGHCSLEAIAGAGALVRHANEGGVSSTVISPSSIEGSSSQNCLGYHRGLCNVNMSVGSECVS